MLLSISFIVNKILYTPAMPVGIYNFVNVPLLCAIFSDNRMWLAWFSVREKEWVIEDISLQEVCMEARKGIGVVG